MKRKVQQFWKSFKNSACNYSLLTDFSSWCSDVTKISWIQRNLIWYRLCRGGCTSTSEMCRHWLLRLLISLPCSMYECKRLHEVSTGNPFCSLPVLPFRLGFFAPLNDIIYPLFLLTTLLTFSGHDAQHDIFL